MEGENPPPLSKRKEKKQKKVIQKIKLPPGSVDVMVQHTNDDSVVSKRSAVAQGYCKDPFLRHFVKKPSRRSPLINRGYYLRMAVMTDFITSCIGWCLKDENKAQRTCGEVPVQVISLGAGYDTLGMRLLLDDKLDMPWQHATHAAEDRTALQRTIRERGVQFYDVDFPAVMQSKAALMGAAPAGTFPDTWTIQPSVDTLPVSSPWYRAVGIDLREADTDFVECLRKSHPSFSTSVTTIFYAECVMQYMPPESAAELIHMLANAFPKAIFVAYDQLKPFDSFGKLMCSSLQQKNSPLLGVHATSDGAAMVKRALHQGMKASRFANFYDLSRHYISQNPHEKSRIAALEPFDEIEEWSEMCEHYGITFAVTDTALLPCGESHPAFRDLRTGASSNGDAVSHDELVNAAWPSGRFGFTGWGHGDVIAEKTDADVLLFSFGGFEVSKSHQRVNALRAHSLREGELKVLLHSADESPIPALTFHSFTRIQPFTYLVIGGRTNPTDVNRQVFRIRVNMTAATAVSAHHTLSATWEPVCVVDAADYEASTCHPLARYRHCAAAVCGRQQVCIYGGKSETGSFVDSFYTLQVVEDSPPRACLEKVQLHGTLPPPLCSAAMLSWGEKQEDAAEEPVLLLSGGLLDTEEATDKLWRIDMHGKTCVVEEGVSVGARFSHSMCTVHLQGKPYLFVLGGSSCQPKETNPLAPRLIDLQTRAVSIRALPQEAPSWSRHTCLELADGAVAVMGGGYTCFSFGTFAAKPSVLLLHPEAHDHLKRLLTPSSSLVSGVNPAVAATTAAATTAVATAATASGAHMANTLPLTVSFHEANLHKFFAQPRPPVKEVQGMDAAVFQRTVQEANQPVVFRRVNLGSCVDKWAAPDYFETVEKDTVVSVHVAEGSYLLDFVRKNFVFRHVRFSELMHHLRDSYAHYKATKQPSDEVWYYRSISAHMKSERANIWTDFAQLGKDFELPTEAQAYVMPRVHQSCLRINAPPLQLWTHYDTMDNVLCQVVGRKRVLLFPPSCYGNLYMNGSSSLVTNLAELDLVQFPRMVDAMKEAVEVTLEPGDMLYFPAMWFHHITTLDDDPLAVSVNVFFEHFQSCAYDRKDLYGNKDLPAVTEARHQITEMAKKILAEARTTVRGEALPLEYAEFALRQAIADLETCADEMAATLQSQRN